VYWEGSGKIYKFKKFSTRVATSAAHHDANNVLSLNVGCSAFDQHQRWSGVNLLNISIVV